MFYSIRSPRKAVLQKNVPVADWNQNKQLHKTAYLIIQSTGTEHLQKVTNSPQLKHTGLKVGTYMYLCSYKAKNLEELIAGFKQFWSSVTPEVCGKYIGHFKQKRLRLWDTIDRVL